MPSPTLGQRRRQPQLPVGGDEPVRARCGRGQKLGDRPTRRDPADVVIATASDRAVNEPERVAAVRTGRDQHGIGVRLQVRGEQVQKRPVRRNLCDQAAIGKDRRRRPQVSVRSERDPIPSVNREAPVRRRAERVDRAGRGDPTDRCTVDEPHVAVRPACDPGQLRRAAHPELGDLPGRDGPSSGAQRQREPDGEREPERRPARPALSHLAATPTAIARETVPPSHMTVNLHKPTRASDRLNRGGPGSGFNEGK